MIIDRGISALVHGREVVYGLNDTEKMFILCLADTFQIPGGKQFDTKMVVHTSKKKTDVRLAQE